MNRIHDLSRSMNWIKLDLLWFWDKFYGSSQNITPFRDNRRLIKKLYLEKCAARRIWGRRDSCPSELLYPFTYVYLKGRDWID